MIPSPRIALGCMRLSSADVDEARAISVIHAALDAGVRALDTADVYAPSDDAIHHNEVLVRRALDAWAGDASSVIVATKGGLTRPGGQPWVPDGRAKHLTAACEASAEALGRPIDLYYLHVPDPRTPIATSVRALVKLRERGLVRAIGVSNVTVAQLDEAARVAEIAAVQVELSPLRDDALRNGVARWCSERGVALWAHTPLGGKRAKKLADHPMLRDLAAEHGMTPHQMALAWLRALDPVIVPVVGVTRAETARASAAAPSVAIDLLPVPKLIQPERINSRTGSESIVLGLGMPGAGKTTHARALVAEGYARLNRDEAGGRVDDLVGELDSLLAGGTPKVVLDNTYPGRAARNRVIEVAARHGAAVRCVWIDTSIEDAQVNAVMRMLERHGRLLGPEEIKRAGRRDPNTFGPNAQFRWRRTFEPPVVEEGFAEIEHVTFVRRWPPAWDRPALIVDAGAVDALACDPSLLREAERAGTPIFGIAWLPDTDETSAAAFFTRANEQLGVAVSWSYCPHPAGPPVCWCRKPLPGLVLAIAHAHSIDLARSRLIGASPADRTLASRLAIPLVAPA